MLKVVFEAVCVDAVSKRLLCVMPYPQLATLFRMDGPEESEDGCFECEEEGARPTD